MKTPQIPPCAACKFQRHKCSEECVFAPYFPADQMEKFQAVHATYPIRNVSRMLSGANPEDRGELVKAIVFEAYAHVQDPVLGTRSPIAYFQQQIKLTKIMIAKARAELSTYKGGGYQISAQYATHQNQGLMHAQQGFGYGVGPPFMISDDPPQQQHDQGLMQMHMDMQQSLYCDADLFMIHGDPPQHQQLLRQQDQALMQMQSGLSDDASPVRIRGHHHPQHQQMLQRLQQDRVLMQTQQGISDDDDDSPIIRDYPPQHQQQMQQNLPHQRTEEDYNVAAAASGHDIEGIQQPQYHNQQHQLQISGKRRKQRHEFETYDFMHSEQETRQQQQGHQSGTHNFMHSRKRPCPPQYQSHQFQALNFMQSEQQQIQTQLLPEHEELPPQQRNQPQRTQYRLQSKELPCQQQHSQSLWEFVQLTHQQHNQHTLQSEESPRQQPEQQIQTQRLFELEQLPHQQHNQPHATQYSLRSEELPRQQRHSQPSSESEQLPLQQRNQPQYRMQSEEFPRQQHHRQPLSESEQMSLQQHNQYQTTQHSLQSEELPCHQHHSQPLLVFEELPLQQQNQQQQLQHEQLQTHSNYCNIRTTSTPPISEL